MARPYSNRLPELLQVISPTERRYLMIFMQRQVGSDKNNYARLLEILLNQKTMDMAAARRDFYKGEKEKKTHFSAMVTYLYELILKGLRSYHEKDTARNKVRVCLQNAEVLFNKSLFEHAKEYLEQAKEVAERYEFGDNMPEILFWYKKLAYAVSDVQWLDENEQDYYEQEMSSLQVLTEQIEAWHLFYKMFIKIRKEAVQRSPERLDELSQLLETFLQGNEPTTMYGSFLKKRAGSLYQYAKGDVQAFYNSGKELLALSEQMKHLFKDDPSQYISLLTNLVASCNYLGKYQEMNEYLDRLRAVEYVSKDDETKIGNQYYQNKLYYCIKIGDYQGGIELMKEAEEFHLKQERRLFSETYYSFYAYICFGVGDYKGALDWLDKLFATKERADLLNVGRIVLLIIHYELGNAFYLESLMRNTFRALHKSSRLYGFEKTVLRFIKNSRNYTTKKQLLEGFKILLDEFTELQDNPQESVMFEYFDFISWLESKIQNRPMQAIVAEKHTLKNNN